MKKFVTILLIALSLPIFSAVPKAPKSADLVFYVNQSVFRESPAAAKLLDRAIKETHGFKDVFNFIKLDKEFASFVNKPEVKAASCDWWLISLSSLNFTNVDGKYKLPQIMIFVAGDFDSERIVDLIHGDTNDENERAIEGAAVKSYELTDEGIKENKFEEYINGRLAYGAADLGVVAIANDKKSLAKAVKLVKGEVGAKKNMSELFQKGGNRLCSLYVKTDEVDVDLLIKNLEINAEPEAVLGINILMDVISEFRAYVTLVDEEKLRIDYEITEKPMRRRSGMGKQINLKDFGREIASEGDLTMKYSDGKLKITQFCSVGDVLKAIDQSMMEGDVQDDDDDEDDEE